MPIFRCLTVGVINFSDDVSRYLSRRKGSNLMDKKPQVLICMDLQD
jgi:hypothetical protein